MADEGVGADGGRGEDDVQSWDSDDMDPDAGNPTNWMLSSTTAPEPGPRADTLTAVAPIIINSTVADTEIGADEVEDQAAQVDTGRLLITPATPQGRPKSADNTGPRRQDVSWALESSTSIGTSSSSDDDEVEEARSWDLNQSDGKSLLVKPRKDDRVDMQASLTSDSQLEGVAAVDSTMVRPPSLARPSMTDNYLTVIQRCSFFSQFPREMFESLYGMLESQVFEKDEVIIREGQEGEAFYILVEGSAAVTRTVKRNDGQEEEQLLATTAPGHMMGDLSLLYGVRCTATIRCNERTKCYKLTKQSFDDPGCQAIKTFLFAQQVETLWTQGEPGLSEKIASCMLPDHFRPKELIVEQNNEEDMVERALVLIVDQVGEAGCYASEASDFKLLKRQYAKTAFTKYDARYASLEVPEESANDIACLILHDDHFDLLPDETKTNAIESSKKLQQLIKRDRGGMVRGELNSMVMDVQAGSAVVEETKMVRRKTDIEGEKAMFINQYKVQKTLGKGSYGTVYLCTTATKDSPLLFHRSGSGSSSIFGSGDSSTNLAGTAVAGTPPKEIKDKQYAVKIVKKSFFKKNLRGQRLRKPTDNVDSGVGWEVSVMKKLRHANIVRLYEVIDDPLEDNLAIVMEFVEGGALSDMMPMKTAKIREVFRSCLRGLEYLHAHGVVHLDIKPANMLWSDEHNKVKICDFGLSRLQDMEGISLPLGTPAFMAPELLKGQKNITTACDIWAMGISLYQMHYNRLPWEEKSPQALAAKIQSTQLLFPQGQGVAKDALIENLLQRMLVKEPLLRMELQDVMQHEWVTNNNVEPMGPITYADSRLFIQKAKLRSASQNPAMGFGHESMDDISHLGSERSWSTSDMNAQLDAVANLDHGTRAQGETFRRSASLTSSRATQSSSNLRLKAVHEHSRYSESGPSNSRNVMDTIDDGDDDGDDEPVLTHSKSLPCVREDEHILMKSNSAIKVSHRLKMMNSGSFDHDEAMAQEALRPQRMSVDTTSTVEDALPRLSTMSIDMIEDVSEGTAARVLERINSGERVTVQAPRTDAGSDTIRPHHASILSDAHPDVAESILRRIEMDNRNRRKAANK